MGAQMMKRDSQTMTEEPTEGRPLDPAKLLRVANLVRGVLEEVRHKAPDDSTAMELASLYSRVEKQLNEALPEELVKELEAIDLDFPFANSVTPEEIRVVYAGLLGWLGGLFQGLQASAQAHAVQLLEAAKPGEPESKPGGEDKDEPEGYL